MTSFLRSPDLYHLNWLWIAVMAAVPPLAGALAALPFWRKREPIVGNLAGTIVIFGAAFAMIVREYAELDRLMDRCLEAGGYLCLPDPSAFMRYAIYACIGLLEVCALFMLSLRVERTIRNRDYAPEWR